ncbi:RING/U-box superfamily protein [Striga asiatica]|uniref:RING/U-box superfamily protein n=1 Tax=Striga asiatica TaxID=4170 RepID=A0A5A7PBZ8_STRAF|nr:RING/U-box superfamily protein [Striga asiatica]
MTLTTANLPEFNRFAVTIAFRNEDNNLGETHIEVDLVMRYAFCAAFVAIFLMVMALIVKLLWISDGDESSNASRRPTESTTLLPSKGQEFVVTIYGTNDSDDHFESGSNNSCSSSSEDLYDGKICVICYDDQRNCFFIPCGHCVTCHKCAHRIVKEESKSCPICRGTIYKVRKLCVM